MYKKITMKTFNRIKVSNNFYPDEFVDPHTYFTETDNGLHLVDPNLFTIAQLLRDYYGKGIRINSWWWYYEKNKLELTEEEMVKRIEKSTTISKWSGIRTSRCSIGASRSAHKLIHSGKGQAIDPKGDQKKFFNIVKTNAEEFYNLGLRRLEDISITPGWLHMDTLERNTQPNSIRVVDRKECTETIRW